MIQTPCVIFAGGKSSRMKEDKSLLPFASYPTLTQYQYTRLSKIFSTVYISCKDTTKYDFQANFIEEHSPVFAPTVGFVTLFEQLKASKVFVLSVDTPFITEKEIKKIFDADKKNYDATIAKTQDKIQPLCGIYHRSMFEIFQKMLQEENHKLSKILNQTTTCFVPFENTQPFMNLNYPQEYKEALKLSNAML
jgi:molybdopterin-guanine dinucleotide biosynthesis protein A